MELANWHSWWKGRGRYGLNRILLEDWNPIGVGVPDDEYSSYAGTVARMLREGAREEEIAAFLSKAATEHIGVSASPAAERAAAAKCVAYFETEMRSVRHDKRA